MAPQPTITVEGVKELQKALRRAKDSTLDAELKDVHAGIAREITQKATRLVPVRSGRLRESIRASGTKAAAVGRAGGGKAAYGPAIHWGWPKRNIEAQPFLTRAAESVERDITDRYQHAIRRLADKIERETP